MIQFFVAVILAYLIGSIPTSYILAKFTTGMDIRKYGSGNIGATNTLRVFGKSMGAVVLLIDMAKGAFCVAALPAVFYNGQLSLPAFKAHIAACVIFGHIWTVFLKFKGGKGVATTCGVFLMLSTPPALIALLIWLFVVILSEYVSLSSIVMAASLPVLMFLFGQPFAYVILGVVIFIIIAYTHRENLKRLIAGKESKITDKIGLRG